MTISIEQKLLWLKGMTERFGAVHQVQAYQLQCYGMLLSNIDSCEVKIDTVNHIITFDAISKKKYRKSNKNWELLNSIKDWIKNILWSDAEYIYKINDRIIYDSRSDKQGKAGTAD